MYKPDQKISFINYIDDGNDRFATEFQLSADPSY